MTSANQVDKTLPVFQGFDSSCQYVFSSLAEAILLTLQLSYKILEQPNKNEIIFVFCFYTYENRTYSGTGFVYL